jgi:hypothetical protein
MSYNKAMKHANNHRKDRFYQPILGMPFDGLKEGEHVESYASIAKRTAESYHVKAFIDNEWKRVSEDYDTEDDAIDKSFELDKIYSRTRIYSDKDMLICGW